MIHAVDARARASPTRTSAPLHGRWCVWLLPYVSADAPQTGSRSNREKSEVLCAGLAALAKLNTAQLKRALSNLEKVKTGHPQKN